MSWIQVVWSFKDAITSAKLAQMVENVRVHDHRADGSQGASFGFTAYTPTWKGNGGTDPAIGNGNLWGRYSKVGSQVSVKLGFVAGSTTTFGSAGWVFGLPPALPSVPFPAGPPAATQLPTKGGGLLLDAGLAVYLVSAVRLFAATNTVDVVVPSAGGSRSGFGAGATQPFTWGTGDELAIAFDYETSA